MEKMHCKRIGSVKDDGSQKQKLPADLDSVSPKLIGRLEDLSNEILYGVFEFLDVSTIYEAFSNLNGRFEHRLINYPLPSNVKLSPLSKMSLERSFYFALVPHQHQIKSMCLSNPILINHVFSSTTNSIVFTRLEKLRLNDFNPDYSEEILTRLVSLPHLTSLTIKFIDWSGIKTTFYQTIFRLPRLKSCHLLGEHSLRDELLPTSENESSSMEHFTLNYGTCIEQTVALLSYLPRLRRLSMDIVKPEFLHRIRIRPRVLDHLTHVTLKVNIDFDIFQTIVRKLFCHVQFFVLSVSDIPAYFDAEAWERLISLHMTKLRIFDIDIFCSSTDYSNFDYYIDLTRQFNSSFWLKRHWFFERYVYKDTEPTTLYLRSLHQERCGHQADINSSKRKSLLDMAHHVNFSSEQSILTCRKYFPKATHLSFSSYDQKNNAIILRTELNRIIPLKHMTRLRFWTVRAPFSQLIELLSNMPNLHTLDTFNTLQSDNLTLFQQSETFLSVSRSNHIRSLTFRGGDTLEAIAFVLALCPKVRHLAIDLCRMNVQLILQFLLTKGNKNTRYLTSLYLSDIEENVKAVKYCIESEKLLDDYLIHEEQSPQRTIYLLWSK